MGGKDKGVVENGPDLLLRRGGRGGEGGNKSIFKNSWVFYNTQTLCCVNETKN